MSQSGVVSPYYANATPWPYLRGPNYTRPIFGEETRRGAFRLHPIVRMPALNGLGCMQKPGSALDILGRLQGVTYKGCGGLGDPVATNASTTAPVVGDPSTAIPASPPLTPQSMCTDAIGAGVDVYTECVKFNAGVLNAINASDAAGLKAKNDAMDAAKAKCDASNPYASNPNAWNTCYWNSLSASTGSWYSNPLYLGAVIIGGAVALALLTRYVRERQE